jgi:hypothetical protein
LLALVTILHSSHVNSCLSRRAICPGNADCRAIRARVQAGNWAGAGELQLNQPAPTAIQPGFTGPTGNSAAQRACRAARLGYRGCAPAYLLARTTTKPGWNE